MLGNAEFQTAILNDSVIAKELELCSQAKSLASQNAANQTFGAGCNLQASRPKTRCAVAPVLRGSGRLTAEHRHLRQIVSAAQRHCRRAFCVCAPSRMARARQENCISWSSSACSGQRLQLVIPHSVPTKSRVPTNPSLLQLRFDRQAPNQRCNNAPIETGLRFTRILPHLAIRQAEPPQGAFVQDQLVARLR